MADYPKMYNKLYKAITHTILALEAVISILKKAQRDTEEMYINAPDPVVMLADIKGKDEPDGKKDEKT